MRVLSSDSISQNQSTPPINLLIYQASNLPTYQSINLSIYPSTNLPTYQSIDLPTYPSINLRINLETPELPTYRCIALTLSVYQSIDLLDNGGSLLRPSSDGSAYQSTNPSIYQFINLPNYQSVNLQYINVST